MEDGVLYKRNVPLGRRMRVVPVSTIPAVWVMITLPPYEIDWSMPQNSLAGIVEVMGV